MKNRIKVAALGLFVVFAGGTCRERVSEVALEATESATPPAQDTSRAASPPADVLPPPSAAPPPKPVLQRIPARSLTPERERRPAMAARAAKSHIVPPIGRHEVINRPIETSPRIEPQPPPPPELEEAAPPQLAPPQMPLPLVLSPLPERLVAPPPVRASRSSGVGLQSAVMGGVGIAGVAMGFAGAEVYQQAPSGGALALTLLGAATTVIGFSFSAVLNERHEASLRAGSLQAQRSTFRVGVGPATAFVGVTY